LTRLPLLQPFIDQDSVLTRAFPPRHLATVIPLYVGLLLLCLTAFNVGWSLTCAHPRIQARKEAAERAGKLE
jgi:Dolichol phosphate-mannose biosynthesis regulatory protein (DPM2)